MATAGEVETNTKATLEFPDMDAPVLVDSQSVAIYIYIYIKVIS